MPREGNDGSHASSIVKLFDYLLTMAWQTYSQTKETSSKVYLISLMEKISDLPLPWHIKDLSYIIIYIIIYIVQFLETKFKTFSCKFVE